jgi:hypothetical protein
MNLGVLLLAARASWATPLATQRLVCVDNGGEPLVDHSVAIVADTAGWIAAGLLASDCSDLRVSALSGDNVPLWIENGTCDTATTRIWVGLDEVPSGPTGLTLELGGAPSARGSDGYAVHFLLFDDFDTFDTARWTRLGGGGTWSAGGEFHSQATQALWSLDPVFASDTTALVVRLDATGGPDDDVEIGGGIIDDVPWATLFWHETRSWLGFSHLSNTGAYFSTVPGTTLAGSCTDIGFATPWLPVGGVGRGYRRVEVTYDSDGTSRISTDAGFDEVRAADTGCEPASPQPALVVLDHSYAGANPEQRLDFVFVRPRVELEPASTVIEDEDADADGVLAWDEGCGDADADGIPDHADPVFDDPTTTTTDTGSTSEPGTTSTSTPVGTSTHGSTSTPGSDPAVDTSEPPGDEVPSRDALAVVGPPPLAGCGCAGSSGRGAGPALALAALAVLCRSRRQRGAGGA